jgi:hypothetical protein
MSAPSYIVTVPADHPDAELVALCNEATTLYYGTNHIVTVAYAAGRLRDPEHRRDVASRVAARDKIVQRIVFISATTLDGVRAKAEILAPVQAMTDPLIASLVTDLVGRKVGATTGRGRAQHARSQRAGPVVRSSACAAC